MRDIYAMRPSVIPSGNIAARETGAVVRGSKETLYDWADRVGTP